MRIVPDAVHTRPSAWKPGSLALKPRSTTTSTAVPSSSSQPSGTAPLARNHVVPHGGPYAEPTSNGVNAWSAVSTASLNGTGSPGTSQALTSRGTRSR